jgi:peptide/nickel transport system substrate-binding protein
VTLARRLASGWHGFECWRWASRWTSSAALWVVLLNTAAHGQGAIPSDSWPQEWFEAPATASAAAIKSFSEAPMLAARVAAGQLPDLQLRLPADPIVTTTAERLGSYGGTLRVFHRDAGLVTGLENPLGIDPDVSNVLPNLAERWEFSDDGRDVTLYLRPGLKWSDGHAFGSADALFHHRHMRLNKDLTPVVQPRWLGATVTAIDAHTVRFSFQEPHPFFPQELAHHGAGFFPPAHFLKAYHPDFVDPDVLDTRAEEAGFISWMAYFNAVRNQTLADPAGTPTMNAFFLTRKSPTLLVYERNPFYPKIDAEGRQLPYVDNVMSLVVQNPEVVTAKTSTGQVHFSAIGLATPDIPLFKRGEGAGQFKTRIWNRLHGVDVVIQPNLTVEDPVLRSIFQDVRFRRALSISINRQEMNTIIYFNRATPRNTTVIPTSMFYEESFATAWSQYDPEEARRLLHEMGLIDTDEDGVRERADGEPLDITLEWHDIETPKGITMELVTSYWRQVGVALHMKQIDSSLQNLRARGNQMDMTLWHADRTTDILFPTEPFWFVPMHRGWEECHWTPWSIWYQSKGAQGQEPPEKARQLIDWWQEMTTSMDRDRRIELGKQILRSQADNVWTIGTLGLAPQPVVVSDELHNVPERGYWGWDNRMTLPYHPETWFLEGQDN